MQVMRPENADTGQWNWRELLTSQALWLGAILLSSGLVCLLAANWTVLDKWTRMVGLQVLLIATVGLTVWEVRRRGNQGVLFLALLMLAAVGVGALLGLVGQTYQTGAQGWQLFAWWTLLLLPWACVARRPGLWIFWIVIFNMASVLWTEAGHSVFRGLFGWGWLGAWQLALPNLIGLALWHFLGERVGATGKAGLRLLTACALWPLAVEVAFGITQLGWEDEWQTGLWALGLVWLLVSVGLFRHHSREGRQDLWVLAIVSVGAMGVSLALLDRLVSMGAVEFRLIVLIIAVTAEAAWVALRLLRLHERLGGSRAGGTDDIPLSVQIVLAFGAWLIMIFGVVLLLLLGVVDSEQGAIVLGVVLMVVAGMMLRPETMRQGGGRGAHVLQQLGVAAAVAGMGFAGFGLFVLLDMPYPALLLGICAAILYVAAPSRMLRFLMGVVQAGALMAVVQWLFWFGLSNDAGMGDSMFWMLGHGLRPLLSSPDVLLLALAAWLAFAQSYGGQRQAALLPAALAWALVAQGASFAMAGLPLSILPQLLVHHPMSGLLALAHVILPAGVALVTLWRLPQRPAVVWLALLPLATLAVALICLSVPAVALAMAWVWIGIGLQRRWLRVFGTLGLLAGLLVYYYSLDVTLLHKSLALLMAGAVALLMAWLLQRGDRTATGAVPTAGASTVPPHGRREAGFRPGVISAGLWGGLACVLLVANIGVVRDESILRHGKPLLLDLAPVDPRALLQGDYMDLSYAAERDLMSYRDEPFAGGFAVFQAGLAQPAELLRVQPQAQPLAEDEVVVALRKDRWGQNSLALTGAYFFAEGLEPYFSPARYGEFRVDGNGRAVLLQLRDEAMQPMQPEVGETQRKAVPQPEE